MLKRLMEMPLWQHSGLAMVSLLAFQTVKNQLDQSYAASGHPVDYATGQLAFDAQKIEGYYAVMQDSVGLQAYWTTQTIDFGFLTMVMVLGVLCATLVARLGLPGSFGRKLAMLAAICAVGGAGMDAAENLLSFAMLQRPLEISQALALTYSSAAAAKFALLCSAMVLLLVALPMGLFERLNAK